MTWTRQHYDTADGTELPVWHRDGPTWRATARKRLDGRWYGFVLFYARTAPPRPALAMPEPCRSGLAMRRALAELMREVES